jgi:FAD binding domain
MTRAQSAHAAASVDRSGEEFTVRSSSVALWRSEHCLDAFNLAWKLALVVRSPCDEQLLDSYSPERSAVDEEVLMSAARLTTIGITRNPVAGTSPVLRKRQAVLPTASIRL